MTCGRERESGRLVYGPESETEPSTSFRGRIFPENITLLPKTASQITGGNSWNERVVTVKKNENVSTILRDLGAIPDDIKSIAIALGPRGRDNGLKEGQKLRILLTMTGMPPHPQPIRVIVAGENAVEAIVAFSDKQGGLFSLKDFTDHTSTWIEPRTEDEDRCSGRSGFMGCGATKWNAGSAPAREKPARRRRTRRTSLRGHAARRSGVRCAPSHRSPRKPP